MMRLWTTIRWRAMRLWIRGRRFLGTRWGRRVRWGLRQLLTLAVVGYLGYRMSGIGWASIWQSLPRTPWFYLVFGAIYLVLPLAQACAFGLIWGRPPLRLLGAALKKRVYDKEVFGHSGDIYMYVWGRSHTEHDDATLLHHVKDNALMSSGASTLVAGVLLILLLALGVVSLPAHIAQHGALYALAGAGGAAVLGWIGVHFRRTVFRLAGRVLALLFTIHLLRVLVIQVLHVVEWKVAIPSVPLAVWSTFLAARIVATRIPLMPSRDLVFMAAGIELAGAMQVPQAAIAGVLGVHSVLDKALNLIVFVGASFWERRRAAASEAPEPDTAPTGPWNRSVEEAPPPAEGLPERARK